MRTHCFSELKKTLTVLSSDNKTVFCKILCKSSYSEYVQHSHCGFKYEINISIPSLVEGFYLKIRLLKKKYTNSK